MGGNYDPEFVTQTERDTWNRVGRNYLDVFARMTGRGAPLLIKAAGIRNGDQVLEIGCGPGYVAGLLSHTGARLVGIDLAPQMVDAARATYPDIEFHEANAEELPFESGRFDVVVACYALHHLARPEQAFTEMHRVLKNAGRLAFVHPLQQESMDIFFEAVAQHHTLEAVPHGPLFGSTDRTLFESMMTTVGLTDCHFENQELALRLASLDPFIGSCRDFLGLDDLSRELWHKIEVTARDNAEAHRHGGQFVFTDTVLLGRAIKASDVAA